ncbi:hypothetical protein FB567DRAFT_39947 [Paraphoma chrysanthemicola]|uniref:Zn(2)-C6 fungal-type domain-containing protein n=1 Tax=Paraphoma chrysanthemicola TaxID=798071 RepID=A0A8K0RIT1_9PLEO|nr:hypothetical protein FB567DRAFT_39947 [Paraphoma chrysanthemicola]
MVQIQSSEKLHAACDECRTRKLKCSGEKPKCTRCKREKIECVFSPQKQMGRPKKRRRDGEADDNGITMTDTASGDFGYDQVSVLHDFGVITPPQYHEANRPVKAVLSDGTMRMPDLTAGSDVFGLSPISSFDFAAEPPIDPSLWDDSIAMDPPLNEPPMDAAIGPCTCLSLMYLTLSELQSVSSFAFPKVVIPLRKAMGVLSDLIHCPQCPKETFSAIQNIQSIVSLCKAIVERFHKVLLEIDAEADRLHQNGEKKPFRIGDNSPENHHLHTGTLDCPMGFNIDIGPREWQRLAKTALRTEIHGGGSNPRPLLQLIKEAEERQKKWHEDKEYCTAERRHLLGERSPDDAKKKCEALGADHIRRVIDNLQWE